MRHVETGHALSLYDVKFKTIKKACKPFYCWFTRFMSIDLN
jgi:hypothetical protein